jgi:ADP-heptose:LPS heptosyltransferase
MDAIPALCDELAARGMGVALIDYEPQPDVPLPDGAIRYCGVGDARELAAAMSAMDCIISPDTGLVHLAAAVGTPAVAISSGIPPELRWSAYPAVTVIDAAKAVDCDYCHDGASCRPAMIGSPSLTGWAPPCMRALSPAYLAEFVAEVVA